jgi:uncharacterized Fe-S cluster protein YjdI
MEVFVGTKAEPKKEWVAPELKKTSIEQITAHGPSGSLDGGGNSKS